jgi:hypothetical protein
MEELGYQNNISELPKLSEFRYENLFKVYKKDNYYIYNIINTLKLDDDIDPEFYYTYKVRRPMPWTIVSYENYETIELWWLICITNKILNPVQFAESGLDLKVIKPEYVRVIIDRILTRINEQQ